MAKNLDKIATWFADKFSNDPSRMLIYTGVAGWLLSSFAQIGAVLFNPKFNKEEKSFMIPQELADAFVNIGAFFIITQATKTVVSKMFKTGKIAPKKVHNFLDNSEVFKNRKGKIDFNLDEIVDSKFPKVEYETYKDLGVTLATVGAGIVSSNIVTPIVRNKVANKMHQNYLDSTKPQQSNMYQRNYNSNLKI